MKQQLKFCTPLYQLKVTLIYAKVGKGWRLITGTREDAADAAATEFCTIVASIRLKPNYEA
jgi:hypothetical protein